MRNMAIFSCATAVSEHSAGLKSPAFAFTRNVKGFNKEEKDCRVVAEAESGRLKVLLTFDLRLLKNLVNHTRGVALRRPSEHWTAMSIPHGERPVWTPHQTHPLYLERWWKWEQ